MENTLSESLLFLRPGLELDFVCYRRFGDVTYDIHGRLLFTICKKVEQQALRSRVLIASLLAGLGTL